MNTSAKIAYYSPGEEQDLEQPIVYGLQSLGFEVRLWHGSVEVSAIKNTDLYIFFARTNWNKEEEARVKALMATELPCYLASPCKHEIKDNPCLKLALETFGGQVPVIYPPYDSAHLAQQLGILRNVSLKQMTHVNQVLVVDDSPSMLAVLEHYVKDLGHSCFATVSAKEALIKLQTGAFDILLTDYQMDEMNGIELIKESRKVFAGIKSILVTSFSEKNIVLEAISNNVDAFLEKPVDFQLLKSTLGRLENMINMRKENSRLLVELTESNTSLKEGRDILNATLECLNEAVLTLDSSFKIISANTAVTELTQYSLDSLLGKSYSSLISEKIWSVLFQLCMETEQGVSLEGTVTRLDGSEFSANFTLRRSFKVIWDVYILVIQDISSQKAVENNLLSINEELESKVLERTQKIEEAKQEAERANKSKSEFLANMSHELRTPMHAIMSFNSLIDKDLASPEVPASIQQKILGFTYRISESSKRLLKLINNLLDISKLETGHSILQKNSLDMLDIIDVVRSDLSPLLQEKGIEVKVNTQLSSTKSNADDEKITQVMFNLLSNACKFSPNDSTIEINIASSEVNVDVRGISPYFVPSLEVSVKDCGVGIPENEIHSIFDKFVQSSKTKTGAGGTGLGLAICKEIIDLHRGKIYVKNNEEKGACFTFNIPVSPINWHKKTAVKGERHER